MVPCIRAWSLDLRIWLYARRLLIPAFVVVWSAIPTFVPKGFAVEFCVTVLVPTPVPKGTGASLEAYWGFNFPVVDFRWFGCW